MRLETVKRAVCELHSYIITITLLSKPGKSVSISIISISSYYITKYTASSSVIALNVTKVEPWCWLLNADSPVSFFFSFSLFFRMFCPTHRAHRHKTIYGILLYICGVLLISQTQDKIQDILIRFQRHWSLFFF